MAKDTSPKIVPTKTKVESASIVVKRDIWARIVPTRKSRTVLTSWSKSVGSARAEDTSVVNAGLCRFHHSVFVKPVLPIGRLSTSLLTSSPSVHLLCSPLSNFPFLPQFQNVSKAVPPLLQMQRRRTHRQGLSLKKILRPKRPSDVVFSVLAQRTRSSRMPTKQKDSKFDSNERNETKRTTREIQN